MKTNISFKKALIGFLVIFQFYLILFAKTSSMNIRIFHAAFLVCFGFYQTESLKPRIRFVLVFLSLLFFSLYFFKYQAVSKMFGLTGRPELLIALIILALLFIIGHLKAPSISILSMIFLSYTFWGRFIPGILGHNGYSLRRVLNYMVWGSQGIFGVGISASSSYILFFVVLGSFLKNSGFSDLVNKTALYFVKNSYGGAGKVAVISSALLGMINGSAVANVATTGTITIPLMKKSGFNPEFAAAVEAASSTGGQFTPPIMGAAGFIMAELLSLPYKYVMLAAAIPASIYYFGIYTGVHLMAKKNKLYNNFEISKADFLNTLKRDWILFLPLPTIIGLLLLKFTPVFSSSVAILVAILSSHFTKNKMGLAEIFNALYDAALSMLNVGISCMMIGLIIGSVSLTGLGLIAGNFIISLLGTNHLFFTGLLVMLVSIVLGMGVPGVAAYVVVSSIAVPILIKSGANPIASHMFCLIYACLANITPPVAISSYVASSIANSDIKKTSIYAMKIAAAGFILPLFFLLSPDLVSNVHLSFTFIIKVLTMFLGSFLITSATIGYFRVELSKISSILLMLIGLLLIHPSLMTDLISLLALLAFIIFGRKYEK